MDSCSYNMIFSSKQNQAVITIRMNAGRQNQQIPISYIHLNFRETLIISYSFICVSCTYTEWLAKENSLTVSVNMCVCVCVCVREREREREWLKRRVSWQPFQSSVHLLLPLTLSATTLEGNLTSHFVPHCFIFLCEIRGLKAGEVLLSYTKSLDNAIIIT